MSDTQLEDQLIEMYVRDIATGPETQSDYQALEAARGKEPDFDRTRLLLRKWRSEFASLKQSNNAQLQALKSLHAIKGESSRDNRGALMRFAVRTFGGQWSEEQKKRFVRVADAFSRGFDYFLSFTGRGPKDADPAVLRVNREYAEFITDVLGADKVSRLDRSRDNLLANAVDYLLKELHCRGFFYPERRGDSAKVMPKLDDAAGRSLTFVQLLDNEMFAAEQDVASNICYWEYKRACAHRLSLLFVFTYADRKELLSKDERQDELDEWYQLVREADLRLLPLAPISKLANLEKIHTEVKNLAAQIKSLRDAAIESVPDAATV